MTEPIWTPELQNHAPALRAHCLWGIAISPSGPSSPPTPTGTSRVGGLPDLPAGSLWPLFSASRAGFHTSLPLAFLTQIDLADISGLTDELPPHGLLSFFTLDDVRLYNSIGWSQPDHRRRDRLKVIYTPPDLRLDPLTPPGDLPKTHLFAPAAVSFTRVLTWPQVEGAVLCQPDATTTDGQISLTTTGWREWAHIAPPSPPAQMLGHPAGCEYPIGADPTTRLLLSLEARASSLPWCLCGRNGYVFVAISALALKNRDWESAFHKEW